MYYLNTNTVNVEIFALYIFSRFSRLSNMGENIYNLKITFFIPHTSNKIKYANLSPREIANFRKFAKIYTRENIYVHSRLGKLHYKKSPLNLEQTKNTFYDDQAG